MRPMTRLALRIGISAAAVVGLFSLRHDSAHAQQRAGAAKWITAWGSSQHTAGSTSITNATVRLVARVTAAGDAVRLRFDNTFGTAPLTIGGASVGQRTQGAAVASKSSQRMLFKGATTVTIPIGESAVSDSVSMKVLAGQDLAVSVYVPGTDVRPSQHTLAFVTSYLSPNGSGDLTAEEARTPFTGTTTSMFWLKGIDVLSPTYRGAIVAFGDSITDGNCSTLDGQNRWEDWLAVRLDLERPKGIAIRKAVVNEGISGNTIAREHLQPGPDSPPGLERLDRDVLSHNGVTDVVLFMATNDIRRESSTAQVIAGTEAIIKRVKAKGLRIVGATVIPRHNVAPSGTNTGWNAAKTQIRNEVNQWVRTKAPFDGFIDFDKAVRDPSNPDLIYPPFNCDDIHPTPRGYYAMGKSVSLDLFRR